MFSVIVAWFVFIFVSLSIPYWIYESYQNFQGKYGEGLRTNWYKVSVWLVLWFVSGVYLFG